MHNLTCWNTTAILVLCGVMAIAAPAQTFETLANFNGTNGSFPGGGFLIQGVNGNLYGTTLGGGKEGDGAVFEVTPEGKVTTLYSFCSKANCSDGETPQAGLVQATNGNFYGTTYSGGSHSQGTVFEITPAGKLTTLYSFCSEKNCADGQNPKSPLIQGTDGNFYGTTIYGGNANSAGTLFEITPPGKLTTLYTFCSTGEANCTDGAYPEGAIVQGTDGNLYGTTSGGGGSADLMPLVSPELAGAIYFFCKSTECDLQHQFNGDAAGGGAKEQILYTFCAKENCADGGGPQGGLMQASNGNFYGTTSGGGAHLYGTAFELSPAGKLTTLYSFCAKAKCTDGAYPSATLFQGTDGNFYGTTAGGNGKCVDLEGCGIAFRLTPVGALTTLHSFDGTDGEYPSAGLLQGTNGEFFGTVTDGGADNDGTIFSLSTGLGPFVETAPTSAIEGATIDIVGQDFTSLSTVKFGDLEATDVKLNGATDLIATVPKGALTGAVTVTTGSTTLTSNLPFGVLPDVSSFSPTSGAVGKSVTITGTGLTQTQAVYFDGVQATDIKLMSDTEVTAIVPTGAKTGPVSVEAKGGTGFSTTNFAVN